jgi:succinate dehydrogenase / fumarate reductase cytochrome b subunit
VHKKVSSLNLLTIKFPITAIVSILHRISGILLFLAIPLLLWVFSESLASAEQYASIKIALNSLTVKLILWFLYSALLYHLLAGARHILIDLSFGRSKQNSKITGSIVLVVAIIGSIGLGVGIW